jgi:hypothetical protein
MQNGLMQKTHLTTDEIAAAAAVLDALPPREIPLPIPAALAKLAPQLSQLRRRGYTNQEAAAAAAGALGVAVTARQVERALATSKALARPQVRGRRARAGAPSGPPAGHL